jgi:type III pantothenate kinase
MILLLDIGNSLLKWGIERGGKIDHGGLLDYRSTGFFNALTRQWMGLTVPELLAISMVGELDVLQQVEHVASQLWPVCPVFKAQSAAYACGVHNSYEQPERLGVDRWLNLIALHHSYPEGGCVVDCGTAVTIDLLSEQGIHHGGLISPGLQLMKKSLLKGTAQLPFSNQNQRIAPADNTEAAIHSGCMLSIAGLIEHVMAGQQTSTVILTGGDAGLIAEQLSIDVIVKNDFVLQGLAILSREKTKI